MSSITSQPAKLDLELVPEEKRLEIRKCNGRLNPRKIQREPTFQVILDALALSPCYFVFLITAELPEVKRFKLTIEIFRDIMKICLRVQGQDFDALPTDEEIMSFLRELRHTEEFNSLNDGMDHQKNVDYVELLWEDFIYQINNEAYKKQEKMYYPRFTKVIIHYFLTQDKTNEKITVENCKGINLLSEVALTKESQYEEVRKKSLRDFYKTHPSGYGTVTKTAPSAAKIKPSVTNKGTGVKPWVPNVMKEISTKTKGDEDEEMDYTTSQLYDDVDIQMNEPVDADEGFIQKEVTDAEMTRVQQRNDNQEISEVIEDAHVTPLSTVPQKTKVSVTSSSHSSDLVAKFLNFADIPTT
nr:hypothetical protein [Tanacetum cinerariifolium]